MIRRALLVAGALLVFGIVNWQVMSKERLRQSGRVAYLELVPVDPRSVMQGDYMALDFALARKIPEKPASGVAILKLDDRKVAHFARIDDGSPLAPDEVRMKFRRRGGAAWLGTNAFFFQEGDSARYRDAKYGEFHFNGGGDAMLVDLRNANLQ